MVPTRLTIGIMIFFASFFLLCNKIHNINNHFGNVQQSNTNETDIKELPNVI